MIVAIVTLFSFYLFQPFLVFFRCIRNDMTSNQSSSTPWSRQERVFLQGLFFDTTPQQGYRDCSLFGRHSLDQLGNRTELIVVLGMERAKLHYQIFLLQPRQIGRRSSRDQVDSSKGPSLWLLWLFCSSCGCCTSSSCWSLRTTSRGKVIESTLFPTRNTCHRTIPILHHPFSGDRIVFGFWFGC